MFKIIIKIRSYNVNLLNKAVNTILKKIKMFFFIKNSSFKTLSIIPLPVKKKNFTVLRSAHIHKKFREQFELKTYTKIILIDILFFNKLYLLFFNKLLYFCKSVIPGIDCQIKYQNIVLFKKI